MRYLTCTSKATFPSTYPTISLSNANFTTHLDFIVHLQSVAHSSGIKAEVEVDARSGVVHLCHPKNIIAVEELLHFSYMVVSVPCFLC